MALQKGDFILTDYVAKVKETNEVFDTTKEEVAKKEHLKKEGEIYESKLVVVGEGWVLKALRRVPLRQLLAKEINPVVGARIEFQGKMATVRSTGAGRVLLDFNPPLAGRTLVYDITVTKKLDDKKEKISALIHRRIPVVEEDKFKLTLRESNLTIDMPEETFYVEGVQIAKRGIAMDIQKFLPDLAETKFVETFKAEPKPAAPAPAVSTPAEETKTAKP
jgi:peptidylprolyl isomerase